MANRESNRQQQQNELEVIQVRVNLLIAHLSKFRIQIAICPKFLRKIWTLVNQYEDFFITFINIS